MLTHKTDSNTKYIETWLKNMVLLSNNIKILSKILPTKCKIKIKMCLKWTNTCKQHNTLFFLTWQFRQLIVCSLPQKGHVMLLWHLLFYSVGVGRRCHLQPDFFTVASQVSKSKEDPSSWVTSQGVCLNFSTRLNPATVLDTHVSFRMELKSLGQQMD